MTIAWIAFGVATFFLVCAVGTAWLAARGDRRKAPQRWWLTACWVGLSLSAQCFTLATAASYAWMTGAYVFDAASLVAAFGSLWTEFRARRRRERNADALPSGR